MCRIAGLTPGKPQSKPNRARVACSVPARAFIIPLDPAAIRARQLAGVFLVSAIPGMQGASAIRIRFNALAAA